MANAVTDLRVTGLVCSVKSSPAPPSSALIAEHVFATLREQGVECEAVRSVDFDTAPFYIAPGAEQDMGDGRQRPAIRQEVLAADILLTRTPV